MSNDYRCDYLINNICEARYTNMGGHKCPDPSERCGFRLQEDWHRKNIKEIENEFGLENEELKRCKE